MEQSRLKGSLIGQELGEVINGLIELSQKSGGKVCGRTLSEDETRLVEEAERDCTLIITSGRQHHTPTPLSTTLLIVREYKFAEGGYSPFIFSAKYEEYNDGKSSRLVRIGLGFAYVK